MKVEKIDGKYRVDGLSYQELYFLIIALQYKATDFDLCEAAAHDLSMMADALDAERQRVIA